MIGFYKLKRYEDKSMLEEFESYFDVIDIKELRSFLKEAKEESAELKKESGDEPEIAHISEFMTTLLENIEDEVREVESLTTLDLKKKIRLYAMVHLFHDLCSAMEDDEDWDDDDEDDEDDEDEDDEDLEEDEDEDSEEEDKKKDGKGRIVKF